MKIIVFGANGRVGNNVVMKLLQENHVVTAFVHGNNPFESHPNLHVVQGDIYDKTAVTDAVRGHDIVMSTLGSWGTPKKDILYTAMCHIIPAMEEMDITRLVSLTGAAAKYPHEKTSLVQAANRFTLGIMAKKILDDGEKHIALLTDSALDWTVIRSPIMNEKGTQEYSLTSSSPAPWATIHRLAVVDALVQQVTDTAWYKQSPFIARGT